MARIRHEKNQPDNIGLLLDITKNISDKCFCLLNDFATAQALLFPGLMTLAINRAPHSEMGQVVGTFTAFFDLAYGVGAVSLGAVASAFGYPGAFAVASAIAASGLALLVLKVERDPSSTAD